MFTGTAAGSSQLPSPLLQGLGSLQKWWEKSPNSDQGRITKHSWPCVPSFSVLLIIRSKQDFGSSTIDHVSKPEMVVQNRMHNQLLQGFSCRALQEQGDHCTTPGQHCSSSLPPEKRNPPRSSRAPLPLLLLPEGAASLQEPCRASGAAFLAQTVFNLEYNEKLDLQTLGKIPRSACRVSIAQSQQRLGQPAWLSPVSQGTPPPTPQQLKGLYKALSKGNCCRINASFFKKIKQTVKEVDNTLH